MLLYNINPTNRTIAALATVWPPYPLTVATTVATCGKNTPARGHRGHRLRPVYRPDGSRLTLCSVYVLRCVATVATEKTLRRYRGEIRGYIGYIGARTRV